MKTREVIRLAVSCQEIQKAVKGTHLSAFKRKQQAKILDLIADNVRLCMLRGLAFSFADFAELDNEPDTLLFGDEGVRISGDKIIPENVLAKLKGINEYLSATYKADIDVSKFGI